MSWKSCIVHASIGILSYVFLFMGSLGGGAYLLLLRLPRAQEVPELFEVAQKVRLSFNWFYYLASFGGITLTIFLGLKNSWGQWSIFSEPKLYSTLILWLALLTGLIIIIFKKRSNKEEVGKTLAWFCIVAFFLALINLLVGNVVFGGNHNFF